MAARISSLGVVESGGEGGAGCGSEGGEGVICGTGGLSCRSGSLMSGGGSAGRLTGLTGEETTGRRGDDCTGKSG